MKCIVWHTMSCLYAPAPACSDLLCLLRRAAHFAHYANADDSAEEDNLHTGGNEVSSLDACPAQCRTPQQSSPTYLEGISQRPSAASPTLVTAARSSRLPCTSRSCKQADRDTAAAVLYGTPLLTGAHAGTVVERPAAGGGPGGGCGGARGQDRRGGSGGGGG